MQDLSRQVQQAMPDTLEDEKTTCLFLEKVEIDEPGLDELADDGKNWYICGWTDINMEDPIKIGIHALCPQFQATSTRFEYLKVYRPG